MSNILFILSGSIACYKACDAVSQLIQRGHQVRTVATEAALRFVGPATLEGLTRQKVATDLFAPGEALEHIDLARWADLTIVCPATANTLNRMAAGLADDLAGALLLARTQSKPLLIAPAMNPAMWHHPATVAAVDRLSTWGAQFVAPGQGRTACGEVGEGRLAEPDEVVMAIESALRPAPNRLRILVTSGGTTEPIDGVRVLTNVSTGATGALLAEHFARAGHDVLLVRANSAVAAPGNAPSETFTTFQDLAAVLNRRLGAESFDVVVHAAAVGDFAVRSIEAGGKAWTPGQGKIPSDAPPVIRLQRTPKLLDSLRARSRNKHLRVVAFKLTRAADAAEIRSAVAAVFSHGAADFVVHNDLSTRASGGVFPADIWRPDGTIAAQCPDRAALASSLEQLLTAGPIATPSQDPKL